MPDYLLLPHRLPNDVDTIGAAAGWEPYFAAFRATGRFRGSSTIGDEWRVSKVGDAPAITRHLTGFSRVGANDLDDARALLAGNPVYENGGVVEIRELPLQQGE